MPSLLRSRGGWVRGVVLCFAAPMWPLCAAPTTLAPRDAHPARPRNPTPAQAARRGVGHAPPQLALPHWRARPGGGRAADRERGASHRGPPAHRAGGGGAGLRGAPRRLGALLPHPNLAGGAADAVPEGGGAVCAAARRARAGRRRDGARVAACASGCCYGAEGAHATRFDPPSPPTHTRHAGAGQDGAGHRAAVSLPGRVASAHRRPLLAAG